MSFGNPRLALLAGVTQGLEKRQRRKVERERQGLLDQSRLAAIDQAKSQQALAEQRARQEGEDRIAAAAQVEADSAAAEEKRVMDNTRVESLVGYFQANRPDLPADQIQALVMTADPNVVAKMLEVEDADEWDIDAVKLQEANEQATFNDSPEHAALVKAATSNDSASIERATQAAYATGTFSGSAIAAAILKLGVVAAGRKDNITRDAADTKAEGTLLASAMLRRHGMNPEAAIDALRIEYDSTPSEDRQAINAAISTMIRVLEARLKSDDAAQAEMRMLGLAPDVRAGLAAQGGTPR